MGFAAERWTCDAADLRDHLPAARGQDISSSPKGKEGTGTCLSTTSQSRERSAAPKEVAPRHTVAATTRGREKFASFPKEVDEQWGTKLCRKEREKGLGGNKVGMNSGSTKRFAYVKEKQLIGSE